MLNWWGASGYRGANTNDFLVAIVVDPSRADAKRYGLVVIAAVASEGPAYKTYWVLREEDMESYLISPASGSVYIESGLGQEVSWFSLGMMAHQQMGGRKR